MFNNESNYLLNGQFMNALMEYLQERPLKESMNFFLAARQSQEFTVEYVAQLIHDGQIQKKDLEEQIKIINERENQKESK